MKLSMISGAVLAIVAASACNAQGAPRRRLAAGDTVFEGPPASAAEIAAIRARGTTVDTIMVSPDHVDLKVGQSVDLHGALSLRAVNAKGKDVGAFVPAFILPRSSAYVQHGLRLRGVKAGVDSFYIEALPRTTSERTRPSTSVRDVVHP